MSELSDFQIVIVPPQGETEEKQGSGAFESRRHSRGSGKVIEKIDDLADIWDQVIAKLADLAAKTQAAAMASQYELSSIEFNVGIEAGLSVGLVTKGDASVSVTFTKRSNSSEKPADENI